MEEIVEKVVKSIIRPFTTESIKKIEEKIEIGKKEKYSEKGTKDKKSKRTLKQNQRTKERPNPALLPGKKFPEKLGEFPKELYGKPIEDLDEFYRNKYTFMVVSKDGTMFRFSATKAFFLLSPFTKLRRGAIYILTHPLIIMTVILVNCVFMADNRDVTIAEFVFTAIFTAEGIVRMLARGFILHEFTYLRDPWNWLDFVVVTSAYLQLILDGRSFLGFLRTLRVFRALKSVAVVPGLKLIVGALMEAVKRLRDVILLTIFMLSVFALIGLQLYHGKLLRKCVKNPNPSWAAYISQHKLWEFRNNSDNWLKHSSGTFEVCEPETTFGKHCPEDYSCLEVGDNPNFGYTNFDTFYFAFLCSFRLMTQDYWESLYQLVLKANGSTHMIFFIFVIFLGSFYLVNLILAIVAMSYDDCRKKEEKEAEEELAAALEEEKRQIELIEEAIHKSPSNMSNVDARRNSDSGSMKDICHTPLEHKTSLKGASTFDVSNSSPPALDSQATAQQLYYMLNRSRFAKHKLLPMSPPRKMIDVSAGNKLTSSFIDTLSQSTSPLPSPRFSFNVSRSSFRLDSQTSDKSFELPEVHVTIEHDDDNIVEAIEEDKAEISSKYLLTSTNIIRRVSIASSMAELGYRDTEALKEFLETCTQGRLSFKDSNISCPEMVLIKVEDILFGWDYPPWWKRICYPIEMFIMDPFVDLFITICIIANTALMALDHADISENLASALKTGNYIFTGIFASEAFLKILALGMLNYLKNRWNIFDLTIVILSSIEVVLRKIKSFSILRSFRLLRIFKLAKSWPTLNLLIGIIGRTIGALGNLCLVLAIIIFIFAVMGVQFFGKDYEKAKHQSESVSRWNFVDFSHSFMIVFRVLCGEWIESMWDCMRWSTSSICIPFFLLTMIIGNLVVLNLFLALLLSSFGNDCFNQEEKINEVTKLKEAAERMHRFVLYLVFKCRHLFRYHFTGLSRNSKKEVDEVQKITRGGALSPTYSNLTHVATVISHDNFDSLQKSQQNSRNPSPSTLADTSDSEDSSNELTSIYGSRVKEVTVVHVNFPNNCCPKTSRCGDLWSASMKTKCGRRWWAFRCYCKILVESKLFEMFTIFIIIVSSLTLAMEDKNIDSKPHLKSTLKNLDKIFTVAFTMELLLKITARGFIHFFKDPWCWLDFIIVAVSLVVEAGENTDLSNMVGFRALRTLRALRPLKAVARWEGMKVVVNALFQAIPAIFNVLLVCLVFWLIFSIIGVTLFAGKFNFCTNDFGTTLLNSSIVANKNQCETLNLTWHRPKVNFDNVAAGYLALFQVATFKGWTDIMKYSTDVTEKDEQPIKDNAPSMYLYFVTFIIFGSFFTLNLFIGVIIDNFNVQKRKAGGSLDMFLTEDQKRYYNAMKKLGSKQPQKPIPKPKIKFQLFFFNLVSNQTFDVAIMCVIVINMICMAVEYHNQPDELEDTLDYINQLFVAIFTMEFFFKLMAYRFYYFKQPWNVFDFVVVIISILGLALMTFVKEHLVSPTLIRVVRVFRVGRILRLVKSAKGIRTLLFSLAVSLPALFNIGLLLFLIMFIYAIFGVSFFMNVKYSNGIDDMFNFETVLNGILILFQIATSAGWHGVLEALRADCDIDNSTESYCWRGAMAIAYLVTYLIISFLVIINMYIAVILENFSQATEDVQRGLTQDDIDMYYETWEKFDEKATGYIKLEKLSEFLDALEPPLGIPAPNYFTIIHLDIPICEDDLVHCVDILDALAKKYLGTSKESARELGDVKKGSGNKNYLASTSTMQRQREIFCAKLIQIVWRNHVEKKKKERMQIESVLGSTNQILIERRCGIDVEVNPDSLRNREDSSKRFQRIGTLECPSLLIVNPLYQPNKLSN